MSKLNIDSLFTIFIYLIHFATQYVFRQLSDNICNFIARHYISSR